MYRLVLLLSATAVAFAESGPAAPPGGVESTGKDAGGGSPFSMLPFFAAIALLFYFMLIRPQQKAEKKRKELIESTKPGDSVVTIGGAIGVVEKVGETQIEVRLGTGDSSVVVAFLKSAVQANQSADKAEAKK